MDKDLILNISNISLYSAFILYLVAVVPFSFSVRSSKKRVKDWCNVNDSRICVTNHLFYNEMDSSRTCPSK